MTILHALMAILAAWRLTEIITQDVIFNKPRAWWLNRFAGKDYANFLTCPRCVSVWTGIAVTLLFYFVPFINWPFALSMMFLVWTNFIGAWNAARQRKIVIFPDLGSVDWGGHAIPRGLQIMREVIQNWSQSSQQKPVSDSSPVPANGRNR